MALLWGLHLEVAPDLAGAPRGDSPQATRGQRPLNRGSRFSTNASAASPAS